MQWLVFTYSFPKQTRSSPRVAVWRRLGRLGAITPTSGVYVLPAHDNCLEAFQWLSREIRQAMGDAVVMRVEQFEGMSDEQLIARFNNARAIEYQNLDDQVTALEKRARKRITDREKSELGTFLDQLRRRYADIARMDYFDSSGGRELGARLAEIARALTPQSAQAFQVPRATLAEYRDKGWVTRPRPHVDRLACAWLIRRFVDPYAIIRYSDRAEPDEIAFDMNEGRFGHVGKHCTFETMLRAFELDDPRLGSLAEIVHEIDLRDGIYRHPAVSGVDSILEGWKQTSLTDAELESHGIALFEGLFRGVGNAGVKSQSKNRRRATRSALSK